MTRTTQWAILLVVLFLIVSMVIVIGVLLTMSGGSVSWTPQKVLYVKLQGAVPELRSRDPLSELLTRDLVDFRDLLDALESAGTDDRIEEVLLDIRDVSMGWAQAEELREALFRLREQRKYATAYFETAGEMLGANGSYYVATACDEIVLAPPGDINLTGLMAETPFLRGMFEKLEITPQFGQRKEFKNAVNTFTEKGYTPAHRAATEALLDSIYDEMVTGIARGRGLTPERVRELIDGGPYTATEALESELVDRLAYHDELVTAVEERVEQFEPLIGIRRYLKGRRPHSSGGDKIAVIYGVGTIVRGPSQGDPLMGELMGSDTITAAFRKAQDDDDIVAVVFRVDSPGGSYVASDLIRHEVRRTRDADKPVVVSMGNLAASGGYFVSMQGDHIFANENTITGSIGVYSGKLVTRGFWNDKLGIRFGLIQRGENAEFMSSQVEWDKLARERMNKLLDRIYDDFVSKAAEGRGMAIDELEPLAHGRVWTGRDALARGLVDDIGGIDAALDKARELAGIPEDGRYRIVVLPEPRGLFQTFFQEQDEIGALPAATRRVLSLLGSLARAETEEGRLLDRSIPDIR
ncbi:MAG: signal peptide peptidase SppA [Acidobacteriota bacterium]|nr:signal peptide peptidase SppA [Acidobacteriota bacterium]